VELGEIYQIQTRLSGFMVLSEPNREFLSVARGRLSPSPSYPNDFAASASTATRVQDQEQGEEKQDISSRFTYLAESAKHSSVASGAIDLVIIREALHWTEIPASISEFARQLKSSGTLCVLQYGPVWIVDNQCAQAVWEGLFCDAVRDLFFGKGDGPDQQSVNSGNASPGNESYILAGRRCATGFDNVRFPSDQWKDGIIRTFTDTAGDLKKLGIAAGASGLGEEDDAVGATDHRIFVEGDREWMAGGCDLAWLQGVYVSFFPWTAHRG
jgi:hypothetical protein